MKFKRFIRESVEDMHKRCEHCDTLLNDSGTCPVCDDGEEDYDNSIEEGLSVRAKLKAAYPELNFDKHETVEEKTITEDLSNKEKLLKAYPELNFDKKTIEEEMASDVAKSVKGTMSALAKQDKHEWARKTADILDTIPDSSLDNLFDSVKNRLSDVRLTSSQKQKIVNSAGDTINTDDVTDNTLGSILNAIDEDSWSKKTAKFVKDFLIVVLSIVAVIEPTPLVEAILVVILSLPDTVLEDILSVFSPKKSEIVTEAQTKTEELTVREKLKAAYPELTFEDSMEESIIGNVVKTVGSALGLTNESAEDFDDDKDYDDDYYDDDYYDLDDVEQDYAHAALYGGDLTYCRECGRKLRKNEWGSYCPDCDPEQDNL